MRAQRLVASLMVFFPSTMDRGSALDAVIVDAGVGRPDRLAAVTGMRRVLTPTGSASEAGGVSASAEADRVSVTTLTNAIKANERNKLMGFTDVLIAKRCVKKLHIT